jgi:signal transduction histidine kinase
MTRHLVSRNSYNNKVARRIFAVFIICALIPLLSMSAISFFYVGIQLKDQAYQRLHQQCKSQGLAIYEHLVSLDNKLGIVVAGYTQGNLQGLERRPFDPLTREGSGFRRIFRLSSDGRTESILTYSKDLCPIAVESMRHLDPQRTLMSCGQAGEKFPPLYIRRALNPGRPEDGYIVGEIDPLFLFGVGYQGALPQEMNMEIRQLDGQLLISSFLGKNRSREFKNIYKQSPMTGKYESVYKGKHYINSYWSLFLKHRFGSPDWIVVLSQPKASVLTPLTRFASIFILMVLLTLLSITLISLQAIRKRTIPIKILQDGAMRIAHGEFGYQVAIASGDEFEALSHTFNEMSTKLKQGQHMLLQAAKMSAFGQMGAGIVHEIGQPLSAISGYAELLQKGMAPDKHQRYLGIIFSETQRLAKIVSKFRIFSRAAQDDAILLDLNEVLENIHDLVGHNLTMKRIRLELHKAERLPWISGDKDALRQVLLNLIMNAADALEEIPEAERLIKITSFADDEMVHVAVSDNGCGIPPEIQQSIFDPFFTTKGEEKGTGLGLAVIGSIIHKHNGRIELESVVQQGTRFTVSFPAVVCPFSGAPPTPVT